VAYLNIDLKVHPMGGEPVVPMTAVFAPDPTQLSGEVNVLLWFHGDKHYWDHTGADFTFPGKSIQYYLTDPKLTLCKLREFILQTSQKKFLLVAPTLNDKTGVSVDADHKNYNPGALRWEQADAEAYLKQVLKGANKYLGANASEVGNIVLAAHSGGGHLQGQMAQHFWGQMFNKVNEVWCFDSTYWGSSPFIAWARKGHSNNPRLWVYSTGGTTGVNAAAIKKLTEPPPPAKPKPAGTTPPAKPNTLLTTKIEVLIDNYPKHGKWSYTDGFWAAYGGSAGGHYEGIGKYLPTLVGNSQNLK
jgi:hypothetical protein